MTARVWWIVVLSLSALACGKEAGRVAFATEGTASSTVALEAGDVSFWTDIDVSFEGDAVARYRVELLQGGTVAATAECDPFGTINVKVGWVETNIGSAHARSGNGKMKCSAQLAHGGPTAVRASFVFSQKPIKLELKKADLVLKQ